MRPYQFISLMAISASILSACTPPVGDIEPRKVKALRAITYNAGYYLVATTVAQHCDEFALKVSYDEFTRSAELITSVEGITREEYFDYMEIEGYRFASDVASREAGPGAFDPNDEGVDFCALGNRLVAEGAESSQYLVKTKNSM